MESFAYLYGKDKSSAEARFGNELLTKFVVFNEKRYFVFDNFATYEAFHAKLPADEQTFHEVVFGISPQKLKFDIDVSQDKLDQYIPQTYDTFVDESSDLARALEACFMLVNEYKFKYILREITNIIIDTFLIKFAIELDETNVVLTDSSGPDKCSAHIIITGWHAANNREAAAFTNYVRELIPAPLMQFVDWDVNKKTQNFRLVNNHKTASQRVKHLITSHKIEATLIRELTGSKLLKKIAEDVDKTAFEAMETSEDMEALIEVASKYAAERAHTFKIRVQNMLIFRRVAASRCEFCAREHENDNTLLITIGPAPACKLYACCRKYNAEHPGAHKSVEIGGFNDESASEGTVLRAITTAQVSREFDVDEIITYNEPEMRAYPLAETLVIRAPMKIGKTRALRDYLDANFPADSIESPIIRFVSFRCAFAQNIAERFADFSLYSTVRGPLNQNRLIIQVESLHRMELMKPDLLILDECELIFEQLSAGLSGRAMNNFAIFAHMLKYAARVICLDAYVSSRSILLLRKLREKPITLVNNTYENQTEDTYYITSKADPWISLMNKYLLAGDRIAVVASSLQEAESVRNFISEHHAGKRSHIYSSETLASEKREHFANVDTYWAQYDVLIYTPTITAGVSFERHHFDRIFAFFTDKSCAVQTCMQMLGRIRNVSQKTYYVRLSLSHETYPIDHVDIMKSLKSTREELTGLTPQLTYDEIGNSIFAESPLFWVWLENTRVKNLSRAFFAREFVSLVRAYGAKTVHLTREVYGNLAEGAASVNTAYKDVCARTKEERADVVAKAEDITDEIAQAIENKKREQQDVSVAERASLERYQFRRFYNYADEIDMHKVLVYWNEQSRKLYKNLCVVARADNSERALEILRKEESETHLYFTSCDPVGRVRDCARDYNYSRQRVALSILRICGWTHLTDATYINECEIQRNINARRDEFIKLLTRANEVYPFKVASVDTFNAAFKGINKILGYMYLRNIKRVNEICNIINKASFIIDDGRVIFAI